jgi:tRNA G18 (ribose-2'-O)-methylase SpoU
MAGRTETREERYLAKMANAARWPVSVCTVNFANDANVAYLARSLACFGGTEMHVIGKVPTNKELMKYSGTHSRFIKFHAHKTPYDFIDYCKINNWQIISAELVEGAVDFHTVKFSKEQQYVFVLGNESIGVPVEILTASAMACYIPMPGFGFCLNTSQTGNILLYEYAKQMRNPEDDSR